MLETLLALAAAHLLSDFIFQTNWIAGNKTQLPILFLHIAIVVIVTASLLGDLHAPILVVVAVTHLAADFVKAKFLPDNLLTFILDQGFHLFVIAVLAASYPMAFSDGVWPAILAENTPIYLDALLITAGFILCVPTGAHIIRLFVAPFRNELPDTEFDGLARGGHYIGCLERGLVFVFVLAGQTLSVGFLITAKSLLRFGEIKDAKHRKVAEYIIIGTFASFGWSLLVSSIALTLVKS